MLTFRESAQSAAVSDLVVTCEHCDSWRTMEDAFGNRAPKALGPCSGARPWLGPGNAEACATGAPKTTLRGASNLYFALVHSALSIPGWDDPVHAAIAQYEEQLARVDSLTKLRSGLEGGFLPNLERFDPERVFDALQRRREQAEKRPTTLDLRREEYAALQSVPDPGRAAAREFQTERVKIPDAFQGPLERTVIVRRLREVRVIG
jgi:hypothetical protein